jgi:transposase
MAKAISIDLRERACEAVSEGLSCHQAAARFKVSPSSVIRWMARRKAMGGIAPQRQGGDRKSARIEAEAAFILGLVEATPDITLEELQTQLKGRGVSVAISTIWRFFDRRQITFKKRQRTRRSRNGPM